jgi:hypothetical protein
MGLPGDEIEMKEGKMYNNGLCLDEGLELKHNYIIPINLGQRMMNEGKISQFDFTPISNDRAIVPLVSSEASKLPESVYYSPPDPVLALCADSSCTLDNFGPIIMGSDEYCVIGDNRHQVLDSRMLGLINSDDILGVVLD